MAFDPVAHGRRSVRLPGYDYGQPGVYYVTVCSYRRECFFGRIVENRIRLSRLGRVVAEEWLRSCEVRSGLRLDAWVVMPNHVHAIVVLGASPSGPLPLGLRWPAEATQRVASAERPRGPAAGSLAGIVGQFKSRAAKRVNVSRGAAGAKLWQRGFHEHVVRDADDLQHIREYIAENPSNWAVDREYPTCRKILGGGDG